MNRTSVILLAIVAGFASGLILSQIIGIIGFLTVDQAVGIRGLPVILAALFAAIAAYRTRLPGRG